MTLSSFIPILLSSSILLATTPVAAQNFFAPTAIASQFALASSTALPFPTQTLSSSDAVSYLKSSSWAITKKGHISNEQDVSFVKDPFNSSNSDPVLAISYPAGSFSNNTGGTSFSTYYNDSSSTGFRTMQLSYQVGFDTGFDFVKGGKLPGLRGGALNGCDGGENSPSCFSVRFMWRKEGNGEAYAYVQGTKNLCKDPDVICNADGFGTSIDRSSFTFIAGTWNQVDMVIGLNDPVSKSNGFLTTYFNGALAINQTGLQIRSKDSVGNIQGLFFSTFFGGNDASWASPKDQSTYYKNIQMFASDSASAMKSSAFLTRSLPSTTVVATALALVAFIVLSHT